MSPVIVPSNENSTDNSHRLNRERPQNHAQAAGRIIRPAVSTMPASLTHRITVNPTSPYNNNLSDDTGRPDASAVTASKAILHQARAARKNRTGIRPDIRYSHFRSTGEMVKILPNSNPNKSTSALFAVEMSSTPRAMLPANNMPVPASSEIPFFLGTSASSNAISTANTVAVGNNGNDRVTASPNPASDACDTPTVKNDSRCAITITDMEAVTIAISNAGSRASRITGLAKKSKIRSLMLVAGCLCMLTGATANAVCIMCYDVDMVAIHGAPDIVRDILTLHGMVMNFLVQAGD